MSKMGREGATAGSHSQSQLKANREGVTERGRKERCAALARLGMFALGAGSAIRAALSPACCWACRSVHAVSAACEQSREKLAPPPKRQRTKNECEGPRDAHINGRTPPLANAPNER